MLVFREQRATCEDRGPGHNFIWQPRQVAREEIGIHQSGVHFEQCRISAVHYFEICGNASSKTHAATALPITIAHGAEASVSTVTTPPQFAELAV